MINFIKEHWVLLLMLAVFIGMPIYFSYLSSVESSKRDAENRKFIDNCVKQDKRVDTVGSIWTEEYLVCNPK